MFTKRLLSFLILMSGFFVGSAQITSPSADYHQSTAYVDGESQDDMFFFCSSDGLAKGSLSVFSSTETSFEWTRYNEESSTFIPYYSEYSQESTVGNLEDGAYRVTYNETGKSNVFTAWVFSNHIEFELAVQERTCDYTKFTSNIVSPISFTYYNLTSGSPIVLSKKYTYKWYDSDDQVSRSQNPAVYDPPAINTNYRCVVSDFTGCTAENTVLYESVVPMADFEWSHEQSSDELEAPLEVFFNNQSDNGDDYIWSLYRSDEDLHKEGLLGDIVDSLLISTEEENPVYTYTSTGTYRVKLHVTKINDAFLCKDSIFLDSPIKIDSSLVSVAPVLTPNSDGINDDLIIKTRSLESLDFQVFNRWGKRVHYFKKNGFIPSDSELAAWDGKINGKTATEGVYFYVVDAVGRDGAVRRTKGFVHLFD